MTSSNPLAPLRAIPVARLRALPKVDLHRHLDCSMRWSTFVELAPQVGLDLPAAGGEWKKEFLITEPMTDLNSVLHKFLKMQKVLASEEILERLAYEACEDAFNDGVQILELRYAPTFITDGHAGLKFDRIHQAFVRGIGRAQKQWPMAVGLIGIIQRIKPVAEARKVMEFIIDHKDSFIAADLADEEDKFDARAFAPLFEDARKAGLHITIHSGEVPHKDAARRVRESIDILGAERIGHGIQIIHDPQMIDYVKSKNIPLEVCPWSNILTSAFPKPEDHPLRQLWDLKVPMTFNSDDPGVFDSVLTDDYNILQTIHRFTIDELKAANETAARSSFIDHKLKLKVWPSLAGVQP